MRIRKHRYPGIMPLGGALAFACMPAAASLLSSNIEFSTTNQSMWDTGATARIDPIHRFDGLSWQIGKNAGSIANPTPLGVSLGEYGAKLSASSKGKIGFQTDIALDSGSVDVRYPIIAGIEYPDPYAVRPGERFTISSNFVLGDDASLSTASPTGEVDVGFVFDFNAKLGYRACFISCASGTPVDIKHSSTTPLIHLDSKARTEQSILGGLATLKAKVPDIQTAGSIQGNQLHSHGSDFLLDVTVDADKVASGFLHLPSLGKTTLPVLGGKVSLSYTVADIAVGVNLDVIQDFVFKAEPQIRLDFDRPVTVIGQSGLQDNVTFALGSSVDLVFDDSFDTLCVTPTYSLKNTLTSTTSLKIDPTFGFEALAVNAKADFPDLVNTFIPDLNIGIGPLVDFDKTFSGPSVEIFNREFPLAGFGPATTNGFEIAPNPIEVVDAFFHPGRANLEIPTGGFTHNLDGSLAVLLRNHSTTRFDGQDIDFTLADQDALFFPGWDDHLTGRNDILATIKDHPLTGTLSPADSLAIDLPFNISRNALNDAIDTSIFPFLHPDEGVFLDPTGRGTLRFISSTGQATELPFRAHGISLPQHVSAPGTAIALVMGMLLLPGCHGNDRRDISLA